MGAPGCGGTASCPPILMNPRQRFGFNGSSALPAGRLIRLQPRGYWSWFQTPVETTRQSLANKLAQGRWDPGLPRFRQRH
ncbi:hypothetical protein DFAR_2910019 [Desulfarculales bacterium]